VQRHDHLLIAASSLLAATPAIVLAAPPMPAFAPADHGALALESTQAARRLPGDIGYLNPRGLSAAELEDALADLADTRALVLDLRTHEGGAADAMLLDHLSWRPIPMATIRRSRDGVTLTRWTGRATPAEAGPHYPDSPVFVLTAATSSLAAEALVYDLRMAGRAVVISGDDALTLAYRRALVAGRRAA